MGEAQRDIEDLLAVGRWMDEKPTRLVKVAEGLLRVRDRSGLERPLRANAVQLAFERERGRQNIVLKARQMGITTWGAGRFFLKTITGRGVMAAQGALRRSKANAGQMCFPELDSEFRVMSAGDENAGRGLTVQYLHCSEVSRWPGDAGGTLAGLRAALAPGGELVMESTPNGAYGCFYEEWGRAGGNGTVRHFFPWWMEGAYMAAPAVGELSEEEARLVARHGLTMGQIGF